MQKNYRSAVNCRYLQMWIKCENGLPYVNRCVAKSTKWIWQMAYSTILDGVGFSQVCNVNVRYGSGGVNLHYDAKFHGSRSNWCWDMAIYRFFKMAAVCHLGFVVGVFGPPMNSSLLVGLYRFAKFGWNPFSIISIICTF